MKRHQESSKRIQEIYRIRKARGGRGEDIGFASWTMPEMRTYLQYKKEPGDPAMPKTMKSLRERCIEISGRRLPCNLPVPNTFNAEHKDSDSDLNETTNVIKAMDV